MYTLRQLSRPRPAFCILNMIPPLHRRWHPTSVLILVVLLGAILSITTATLTPGSKRRGTAAKKTTSKELKLHSGPHDRTVFDRDLVQDEPVARDIITEHATYYKDTNLRQFTGTVLGYVTPWNNHGYDVAKIFGRKFDVVSPVWLQVRRSDGGKYEVTGTHDIDSGWTEDVRKAGGRKNKILPRILFDKFTDKDFSALLTHQHESQAAIDVIVDAVRRHSFDGIVLELWSQLSARVDDDVLLRLVRAIAAALAVHGKQLVLVIPPMRDGMHDLFSAEHFAQLVDHVAGFSLMTYDFSSAERPGPNAPKYWVEQAVKHICPDGVKDVAAKRKKILIGLNLYGNDFTQDGGGSIVGQQYVKMLGRLQGRVQLDERDDENFFEFKDEDGRHYVFYPTLYSIQQRIELAKQLGCGLSLWELGQGLDYFYDLF